MWILANALVILSITHGVHSQHAPCPQTSWHALLEATAKLLDAAKSQYVVLFADRSQLTWDFLVHAHGSDARVLLLGCDNNVTEIGRFLSTVKGRCFIYCSFICLCQNIIKVGTILDAAENGNLIRPWTLWLFLLEDVLPLMISRKLGTTGVPIAIPFENNITQTMGCSTAEKSIRVMSLLGNSAKSKAVFHYNSIIDIHDKESIFLAGESDGKYRILNMENVTVTAAASEFPPFFTFYTNTTIAKEGICLEMLNTFQSSMNFSYTIDKEKTTGIVKDGIWTGIIGRIANKSVDIGLGGITITSERAEVVGFTNPFMEDMSGILSPAPGPRNNVFMFVHIFPWQVWAMLLVTIIIMGPTLALIENYPRADFVALSWLVVANVLQQGDLNPEKNASRVLASFWLFFLVVFMGTYSGLMLAIMSFPGMEAPLETLEQLANDDSVIPTIFSQSSTRMYIENGTSKANIKLSKIWNSTGDVVTSLNSSLDKLSTGQYAFIGERVNFRELIYRRLSNCSCCPFYESRQDFLKHQYSLALGTNSPLMGSFNNILRQLREKGLIAHWISKYQRDIERCSETHLKSADNTRPLRLQDLLGAIVTLSLGLGAALICLIIEHCVACRKLWKTKCPIQRMK